MSFIRSFFSSSSSSKPEDSTPSKYAWSCGDYVGLSREAKQSDEIYRSRLTAEQFHVSRQAGTERAFTGKYWNHHEKGVYVCVCCSLPLFDSSAKFDSGTGWPSFWEQIGKNVTKKEDESLGMVRVEVNCTNCDGHLGHLFDDGPRQKTGLRYCINSASLNFVKDESDTNKGKVEDVIADHQNVCAVKEKETSK